MQLGVLWTSSVGVVRTEKARSFHLCADSAVERDRQRPLQYDRGSEQGVVVKDVSTAYLRRCDLHTLDAGRRLLHATISRDEDAVSRVGGRMDEQRGRYSVHAVMDYGIIMSVLQMHASEAQMGTGWVYCFESFSGRVRCMCACE